METGFQDFFHTMHATRKQANSVPMIKNEVDVWLSTQEEIMVAFVNHYSNAFNKGHVMVEEERIISTSREARLWL